MYKTKVIKVMKCVQDIELQQGKPAIYYDKDNK